MSATPPAVAPATIPTGTPSPAGGGGEGEPSGGGALSAVTVSAAAPQRKVMDPTVERLVSGQSAYDESKNVTRGEFSPAGTGPGAVDGSLEKLKVRDFVLDPFNIK